MIKDATFFRAVIQCAQTGTLQNVVADEAHPFAIHGASFLVEICILRKVFYKPSFAARYHPVFIALSNINLLPIGQPNMGFSGIISTKEHPHHPMMYFQVHR